MPRVNKIIQYGYENQVLKLKDMGLSVTKIADEINSSQDDFTTSTMGIQRFLESNKIRDIKEEIQQGLDPMEDLRSEFRDKMYDLDDETHATLKEAKGLLKDSKRVLKLAQKSENAKLQLEAIKRAEGTLKTYVSSIEQVRRNWNTFIENGYRQFGTVQQAHQTNYIQVNNMLVDFMNELCPDCRHRVVKIITQQEV